VPRSVTYDADFQHSAETVFEQGKRKDYIEAKAPALAHHKAELVSLEDGPEGGSATARYEVEPELPPWAKKIVPARAPVTEVQSWGPAAADGARDVTIVVRIQGVPVEIKGSMKIVPTGPASCRSEAVMNVRAQLPIFGPKLEEVVADDLRKTMVLEAEVMQKWLATHA
jgi:Protein of unknown function (DUF2505)